MSRFGYTIVHVPDVRAAVEFYEKAFGLGRRFVDEAGQYAEMETGSTALAFASEELIAGNFALEVRHTRATEAPPAVELALVDDDVARAHQQAIAVGAVEVSPPAQMPWGQTISYVRDLNGLLVEICSPIGSA